MTEHGLTNRHIIAAFNAHWTGTDEDLAAALEAFYQDIRRTTVIAMRGDEIVSRRDVVAILDEVDDYFTDRYGLD